MDLTDSYQVMASMSGSRLAGDTQDYRREVFGQIRAIGVLEAVGGVMVATSGSEGREMASRVVREALQASSSGHASATSGILGHVRSRGEGSGRTRRRMGESSGRA